MKKLLLILLFVVTAFTAKAQCNYTLEMTDAWGDGWDNGAGTGTSTNSVDILVNGVVVLDDVFELGGGGGGTPTITNLTFLVNPGDDVTAVWTGGGINAPNWEQECSYRILDADGAEVAAVNPIVDGSGDITTGTITAACPACTAPNSLSVSGIGGTTATLNWVDGNAPSTGFTLEVNDVTGGGTNIFNGSATSPHNLTGLTGAGNVYEFRVTADCSGTPSSPSAYLQWVQDDVPGCSSNPSPTNGEIDVAPSATFTWDAPVSGGAPTGYNFYLGTVSGTLNNIGTVAGTTANITNLAVSTTYYWSIVPVNGSGEATGCPEWSFTIVDPPAGPIGVTCPSGNNVNAFTESFDSVGGWTGDVTATATNDLWVFGQAGSTASPNTGPTAGETGAYMYYEASGAAVNTASAVSPAIDLTAILAADPAELSFYMHAFGSAMGTLNVGVGATPTGTFTNVLTWSGQIQLATDDAWHQVGIDVSSYTGQTIYLEFSYTSTAGFAGDMSIDSLVIETCGDICEDPTNLVANDFTITPTLDVSWDAVATATSYTWEIQPLGTGQGAGIALASGVGAPTSYDNVAGVFTDGDSFSLFVLATCPIGNSNYSQLDFTVVLPGTAYCGAYSSSPAAPINEITAVEDVISAVGSGFDTITDLDVAMDISHTWIGDMSIILTSPSGTSVLLLNGPCGDFDDMNIRLDDEGGAGTCASPTIGTAQPLGALSDFDGEVFEGNWTLTIIDNVTGDDGVLNTWCLIPTLTPSTTCTGGTTATWDGTSWDTGTAPTSIDNAVIRNSTFDTTANGDLEACSLSLIGGTLIINADEYARIQESIIVDDLSTITVLSEGSLVQVNDAASVANSGNINVLIQTPSLNARDFMIMGSPMTFEGPAAFVDMNGAGNPAYQVLNHTTANFTPYVGTPAVVGVNFHDQESNDWSNYTGLLFPGEGYLVRPSYVASGAYDYTFDGGSLNNGVITYPAEFGDDKEDSPNVLSNPYASAIDADLLIGDNAVIDEVYFWEHLTTPAAGIPGPLLYNFDMEDISTRNIGMGIPAANDPGASTTPNGVISSGQGFGIKANAMGDVTFTNSMRLTTGNNTLRTNVEKDLLWIEVRENTYNMGSTTGICFTENASENFDAGYDTMKLGTVVSLYSHLPDGSQILGIQSREAFDTGITIPMGFSTMITADAGIPYVISIQNSEGVNIENVNIYLVDHLTNSTTNLSANRYEFLSDAGTFDNRFTLIFESVLGVNDNLLDSVVLYPNPTENILNITSPNAVVTSVEVMDLMGRKVTDTNFTTESNYTINLSQLEGAVYFVTINTDKGSITKQVTKK